MRSLLKWMNRQLGGDQAQPVMPEATSPSAAIAMPLVEYKAVVPDHAPAPAARPAAPRPVARTHLREATAPEASKAKPSLPSILFTGGPELQISVKAGTVYGTCPHAECGSRWNVRERMLRHKLSTSAEARPLTCPSCDHPVALPQTMDLRKLS